MNSTEIITINHEDRLLENVINKLQIYMEQHDDTLYALAAKVGFAYQPFYRLINKKHMPTLGSLVMIAEHFSCTVAELIDENVFIDIDLFESTNKLTDSMAKIRVYIAYAKFLPLIHEQFFALRFSPKEQAILPNQDDQIDSAFKQVCVCYKITDIKIDGIFLVKYKNKITLLNILSISSKYVVVDFNGIETKVDKEQLTPIAQFFGYLNLSNHNELILRGVIQ